MSRVTRSADPSPSWTIPAGLDCIRLAAPAQRTQHAGVISRDVDTVPITILEFKHADFEGAREQGQRLRRTPFVVQHDSERVHGIRRVNLCGSLE